MKKFDTTLYFITDSTGLEENVFLYKVEQALSGGVTIIQLREKNKSTREYMHLAEKVHEISGDEKKERYAREYGKENCR